MWRSRRFSWWQSRRANAVVLFMHYPRPPATFVGNVEGCVWYRTPLMWPKIRQLRLSLSRFLSSLSRLTRRWPKIRSGAQSGPWSTTGRVLRTGGLAISYSLSRGSLFLLLREKSSRSGLWLLSEQLAPRCCRLGFRLVLTTPGVSVHPGHCSPGSQSRRFNRQPIGGRLICLSPFILGMSPPLSWISHVQLCWRRFIPVSSIHCPLWGSRSQASRTVPCGSSIRIDRWMYVLK